MAMDRGTTDKTAKNFVRTSTTGVRPATSGNKNVNARRSPAPSPTTFLRGSVTRPLAGPDKGAG